MSITKGTDRMESASGLSVANDGIHRPHGEYTSGSLESQAKGKEFDMETPLVKGGCGHSAKELEDSAMICVVSAIVIAVIMVLAAILA